MTFAIDDDHRRYLDPVQIARARWLFDSGWAIASVAQDCGLSVQELRSQLGLPQWADEPRNDQSEIGS